MWQPDRVQWITIWTAFLLGSLMVADDAIGPAVFFAIVALLIIWYREGRRTTQVVVSEVIHEEVKPSTVPVEQAIGTPVEVLTVADQTEKNRHDESGGRPYRWGKFQGWCLVLGVPILTVLLLTIAGTPAEHERAIEYVLFSALAIPMGLGILKKRRYGLILVYVTLGLICVLVLIGFAMGGVDAARVGASGGPFWVACTLYYHKRKAEFT